MKAATRPRGIHTRECRISIHAAREGGDNSVTHGLRNPPPISIHAAREGGDLKRSACQLRFRISIHAAREGGDCMELHVRRMDDNFNPRRP